MGRSRGGLTTKIHTVADAQGRPVRFILTAGEAADIKSAPDLLAGLAPGGVIADKAYDSNELRKLIAEVGAEAVIPSNRSRKLIIPHDAEAYRLRNRIERFFNKLKHFRRIATRYDKLARNYAGFLNLVAALKCCL